MLRALAPYLLISAPILVGGAVAYDDGARVWALYLVIALVVLILVPAYIRWDRRHHP